MIRDNQPKDISEKTLTIDTYECNKLINNSTNLVMINLLKPNFRVDKLFIYFFKKNWIYKTSFNIFVLI